jgi:hypothetical protein
VFLAGGIRRRIRGSESELGHHLGHRLADVGPFPDIVRVPERVALARLVQKEHFLDHADEATKFQNREV